MKMFLSTALIVLATAASGQSITGKWQLSEQKTCFQADMKESDTEKELSSAMSSSSSASVAKVMELDEKGNGSEGIFSAGKKKATSRTEFKFQVSGQEFQKLDKKSGMITSRWVIDELTETTLKIHDASRDCETKTYIRVK